MLGRGHLADGRDVALGQGGQLAGRLVVLVRPVVAALGVDPGEALEQGLRRARAQLVAAVGQVDRGRLELLGRHLRGQRALPDQAVQAQLVGGDHPGQRIRVAVERGRPDRLVGFLGALRLGLVDPALGHRERRPVALADDLAGLAHGHPGDRRRVGPHVGDEPDMAVRRVDALVQPLGDRHRPLRAVGQLAAGLLLEGGRRERRRRRSLLGPDRDLADLRTRLAQRRDMAGGGGLVGHVERLAIDAHELGGERLAGRGRQDRLDRPVLAGREGIDGALALHDQADRDRLDTARGQAAHDLARQERAQGVAHEPVDDAPGLLGVDEVLVDVARVGERLADGGLGDLAEGHATGLGRGHVGRFGDVPGDGLALAVEVGGEIDHVAAARRAGDVVDALAAVRADDVLGGEVVVDVDAELALARVLGQVAHVAIGGEDAVVGAQIAFDRPRLGRRFDDHEVLWHGRECSTGSCTRL